MPKSDLSQLSDDELEAERKRRRAAARPKSYKVREYEVDEATYRRLIGGGAEVVDEDDEDDEDDGGGGKNGAGYFG